MDLRPHCAACAPAATVRHALATAGTGEIPGRMGPGVWARSAVPGFRIDPHLHGIQRFSRFIVDGGFTLGGVLCLTKGSGVHTAVGECL